MHRGRFRRRVTAVAGVLGLLGALLVALTAAPAAATPVPPSTSSCTYNGNPAVITGASNTVGTSVAVSCTGLPVSTTVAVAQASPLGGVLSGGSGTNEADVGTAVVTSTSATGTLTATINVTATGGTPAFTASDPNAVCPPTQAQVNAGLTNCVVAVATTTGTVFNVAGVVYGTQPSPAAPTLALTPNSGVVKGDVLSASDAASPSGFWWGAATTGASSSSTPASIVAQVGGVAATSSLTISPTVYCQQNTAAPCTGLALGTLINPKLSGTITVPATAATGAVIVDEINTTPDAGNGTLPSLNPPAANVEATATVTLAGTPTLSASPSSGGNGTAVSLSGSNWDSQGSAVTVSFSVANAGQTVDSVTLTPSASGTISGTITVNTVKEAQGSNPLVGTQTAHAGTTLTATAAFTVVPFSTTCSTSGSPNSCKIQEFVTQSVTGDPNGLTISDGPAGGTPPTVTMNPVILNGTVQTTTGNLAPVTLDDNRGTLVGWSLTAQFNSDNFACTGTGGAACPGAHPIDNTIPASNMLLVAPSVACTSAGNPATVPPTPPSCVITEVTQAPANHQVFGPSGTAASLGTAPAGGGGGGFTANSPVSLLVPPFIAAGTYSNVLNITVT